MQMVGWCQGQGPLSFMGIQQIHRQEMLHREEAKEFNHKAGETGGELLEVTYPNG